MTFIPTTNTSIILQLQQQYYDYYYSILQTFLSVSNNSTHFRHGSNHSKNHTILTNNNNNNKNNSNRLLRIVILVSSLPLFVQSNTSLSSSTTTSSTTLPKSLPKSSRIPCSTNYNNQNSNNDNDNNDNDNITISKSKFDPSQKQQKQKQQRLAASLPWNASPKIDPNGFLTEPYYRIPGPWEEILSTPSTPSTSSSSSSNFSPNDTPSSQSSSSSSSLLQENNENDESLLSSQPVVIRQVPGDGNCLFHSISVALAALTNQTHVDMTGEYYNPYSIYNDDEDEDEYDDDDCRNHDDNHLNDDNDDEYRVKNNNLQSRKRIYKHPFYNYHCHLDEDMDEYDTGEYDNNDNDDDSEYDDYTTPNHFNNFNSKSNHYYHHYHHDLSHLYTTSSQLRKYAVEMLYRKPKRKLFLQGNEYLRARDLVNAAAAQYNLTAEEYCRLMRKDSYWGGGPEIVALCNVLKRPIHVYELIHTSTSSSNDEEDTLHPNEDTTATTTTILETTDSKSNLPTTSTSTTTTTPQLSSQFRLRRMACFGSPKFDHSLPIHILSADSRFPDIQPGEQLSSGNHFLTIFPMSYMENVKVAELERMRSWRREMRQRRRRGGGGQGSSSSRRKRRNRHDDKVQEPTHVRGGDLKNGWLRSSFRNRSSFSQQKSATTMDNDDPNNRSSIKQSKRTRQGNHREGRREIHRVGWNTNLTKAFISCLEYIMKSILHAR